MSEITDLVSKAAKLDTTNLESLIKHLQALQGTGEVVTTRSTHQAEELYQCLERAAMSQRRTKLQHISVLKKSPRWAAFTRVAADVDAFVSDLEKDRVKKLAATQYCCDLLINHLIKNGMRLEIPGIIWGLDNLTDIIDQHFPGYLASGLMGKVLETLYSRGKSKLRFSRKS